MIDNEYYWKIKESIFIDISYFFETQKRLYFIKKIIYILWQKIHTIYRN